MEYELQIVILCSILLLCTCEAVASANEDRIHKFHVVTTDLDMTFISFIEMNPLEDIMKIIKYVYDFLFICHLESPL